MIFTYYGENPQGEQLDSELLMFDERQKAYVQLLEDEIKTLRFKPQEQIRETREKILEEWR